jgi:hypothetical protein
MRGSREPIGQTRSQLLEAPEWTDRIFNGDNMSCIADISHDARARHDEQSMLDGKLPRIMISEIIAQSEEKNST